MTLQQDIQQLEKRIPPLLKEVEKRREHLQQKQKESSHGLWNFLADEKGVVYSDEWLPSTHSSFPCEWNDPMRIYVRICVIQKVQESWFLILVQCGDLGRGEKKKKEKKQEQPIWFPRFWLSYTPSHTSVGTTLTGGTISNCIRKYKRQEKKEKEQLWNWQRKIKQRFIESISAGAKQRVSRE